MQDPATVISWRGFEHRHIEHSTDWYWALGIVTLSTALISLLFSNVLFALLIVIAGTTVGIAASRPLEESGISLTTRELIVRHEKYPLSEVRAFWIEEGDGNSPRLFIDTPRVFAPDVIVPIPETLIDQVRNRFIDADIPEIPMEDPLPHRILEYLGF